MSSFNVSIQTKLNNLALRLEEINALLSDPEIQGDQNRFRDLSIELSEISPVVEHYQQYIDLKQEIDATNAMRQDDDSSIREMANEEMPVLEKQFTEQQQQIHKLYF